MERSRPEGTKDGGSGWQRPRTPPRWFVRSCWFGRRALCRLTGGRLGLRPARPGRWGMLRLHTLGRRSGQERLAIVGYIEVGEDIVLLATNGTAEAPPAWWLNLQDTPDAIIDLPGEIREVRAREARGAERERLWAAWLDEGDDLERQQDAMQRRIAVIVLEPRPL